MSDWRTRFAKAKAVVKGRFRALAVQTLAGDSILLPLAGHGRFWRGAMEDADLLSFLAAELPDDGAFLDVGANVGVYSATLALARRGLRGAAFEPVPATHAILAETFRLNQTSRFLAERLALGDAEGELLFSAHRGGANNYVVAEASSSVPTVSVRCVRLDDWVAAHPALAPDAIKIDVEGHELAVLEGAVRVLTERRPALVLECHCASWREPAMSARRLTALLAQAGYRDLRDRRGAPVQLADARQTVHVLCTARPR